MVERWWEGVQKGAGGGQVTGPPLVSAERFGPYSEGSGSPWGPMDVWVCVCVCVCVREREDQIVFLKITHCDVED